MNTQVKIYRIPLWERLFIGAFLFLFGVAVLLIIIESFREPAWICFLVFMIIPSLFALFYLNLFRSIGFTESHLRLYTFLGTYKSVPWRNINGIHRPKFFAFPRFFQKSNTLIVKCNDLGFMYKLYGLIYDGGGEGFLVSHQIAQDEEFRSRLLEHFPGAVL